MPDVSQPFAVRRGTHAGHISRSLAARLLGAAAMDSHNGTTLIDPRIRNRAAWASGVPAATDAFRSPEGRVQEILDLMVGERSRVSAGRPAGPPGREGSSEVRWIRRPLLDPVLQQEVLLKEGSLVTSRWACPRESPSKRINPPDGRRRGRRGNRSAPAPVSTRRVEAQLHGRDPGDRSLHRSRGTAPSPPSYRARPRSYRIPPTPTPLKLPHGCWERSPV
jgi:hypothetical protein